MKGKVIVDGANMSKRHTKPRGQTMQGGIIDKDMPLPAVRGRHRVLFVWAPQPDRDA